jgi:two-component system, NtrC family, sensor histidine kinase HydH
MWNKIIAPTLLVVLFWLAFSGAVVIWMYQMEQFHGRVVAENGTTIQAAGGMSETIWRILAVTLAADPSHADEMSMSIFDLEKQFERHLKVAEETSFTTVEQTLSRKVRDQFKAFSTEIKRRMMTSPSVTRADNIANSNANLLIMAKEVAEPCTELRVVNERLAGEATSWQGRFVTLIALVFVGIVLLGATGGILWSMHNATHLESSISEISISLEGADSRMQEELGRIGLQASGDLERVQEQVQLVTERIRQVVGELQQERRKAIEAARRAAAGELAAGVAHEIRNPLTSVKLLLHAASEQKPVMSFSKRQLQAIESEIVRMEKTVQGLLDFARPPQMHRVCHDLRASVTGALILIEGLAAKKSVVVHRDLPECEVRVNADPGQLHQVFVNLLLNAIEAMPSGGNLQISVEKDSPSPGTHRVVFTDSGPGLPANILERLFEPFVTGKPSGTGLGLAVSSRLIKEHDGQLSAVNGFTGGAVVTVELPGMRVLEPEHHG